MKLIFYNVSNGAVTINDICGALTKWHNAEEKNMFKAADFLMNDQPCTTLKKDTRLYNIGKEQVE